MDIFNKKKIKEQEQIIKKLNFLLSEKNQEIHRQNNSINHLETNQSKMIEENQKLISWIMQIMDTVGTMETREKLNFRIPVYKEYRAYDNNFMGIFEKERITIPEITIIKMG